MNNKETTNPKGASKTEMSAEEKINKFAKDFINQPELIEVISGEYYNTTDEAEGV